MTTTLQWLPSYDDHPVTTTTLIKENWVMTTTLQWLPSYDDHPVTTTTLIKESLKTLAKPKKNSLQQLAELRWPPGYDKHPVKTHPVFVSVPETSQLANTRTTPQDPTLHRVCLAKYWKTYRICAVWHSAKEWGLVTSKARKTTLTPPSYAWVYDWKRDWC